MLSIMFVLHSLATCCAVPQYAAQVCQDSLPCRMICLTSRPGSLWLTGHASWHAAECHIENAMTLFLALLGQGQLIN